jgi:hypothetical protein
MFWYWAKCNAKFHLYYQENKVPQAVQDAEIAQFENGDVMALLRDPARLRAAEPAEPATPSQAPTTHPPTNESGEPRRRWTWQTHDGSRRSATGHFVAVEGRHVLLSLGNDYPLAIPRFAFRRADRLYLYGAEARARSSIDYDADDERPNDSAPAEKRLEG